MQELENLIRYYQHRIDKAKEDTANLKAYAEERKWERPLNPCELNTWIEMIARNDRHIEIYTSTIKYLQEVKNEYTGEIACNSK